MGSGNHALANAARPSVAETIKVSKRFGASQALSDVSVVIQAGESRALVGRNGAGKSTLVAMLTGIIPPDSGSIRLAGEDAPAIGERQKWRDRVACVYQKSTLIPDLTVAENLFLNSQPTTALGSWISWSQLRHQAESVLADWGLDVDVAVEAGTLSVEKRHIVEIARALRQGSRFIILDEPTAELEGREVARLFERIVHLRQSGVTFLYISHYLEEIYESATASRFYATAKWLPTRRSPKCPRSVLSARWSAMLPGAPAVAAAHALLRAQRRMLPLAWKYVVSASTI